MRVILYKQHLYNGTYILFNAYRRKTGLISSGCNTKDSMGNRYPENLHADQITVLECHYSMSKLPSQPGIKHNGIQITKPKDKASPLLATAFAKQEHLEGTIILYRTNEKGRYEKHYAIEFQKAVITGNPQSCCPYCRKS
ncbi:type VI secretion system tube protein TssD [Vibrio sp. PP-XX7]